MPPESAESRWDALADSVSNGSPIDWHRVEQEATGDEDLVAQARKRDRHELADGAREWFSKNGQPWICAREISSVESHREKVKIGETAFSSQRLH